MSFRARITDANALREISPAALRAYALAQGWQRLEEYGAHSDVYVLGGEDEILIPGTVSLADYSRIVSDVIAILSRVEGREELQVYRDLVTADQDVIRVRAPEADDAGALKLESGVIFVERARDLLLSAACSASSPRAAYRAGKLKEATDYLRRVRLGQTERGSFVLTLLSPVPPTLETTNQPSLWPLLPEEPFERRVTRRLVQGLNSTRAAIEGTNRFGGFSAFEDAVRRGVSANLCEAIAGLIEENNGLDVSVTWARTRPAPERRAKIEFTTADVDILNEAARLFREREPRPNEVLEGYFTQFAREEGAPDGRAVLRSFIDTRPASVRIDLSQQDYELAVTLHREQRPVSIAGDLVREGQRWRLKNPRDLSPFEVDDDADESLNSDSGNEE